MSCCFGNLFNCSRSATCANEDVAMRIVRATSGCHSCGCGGNYYITIGGCGCQDGCGYVETANTCEGCGGWSGCGCANTWNGCGCNG